MVPPLDPRKATARSIAHGRSPGRPARPPHGRPAPLCRDGLAAPPSVRPPRGSSAGNGVTGTRPREAGPSRSTAPADPAWPRLPGPSLRLPGRPSAQTRGSDPAGRRAQAGGVQVGTHTESRPCTHTCVHTHACPGRHQPGRGAWGKTGRGHLGGGTVPGEAVRATRPTSREEKEGPAPPASHRGVCRPGVPHAAWAPVARAQTTLSTHTRETQGENMREDRG